MDDLDKIIKETIREKLIEYDINQATEGEHNDAIEAMAAHLDDQDNGKVGIFWFDRVTRSLFGVIAVDKDSFVRPNVGGGLITCRELHSKVWQKGFNKQKYKYDGKGPFVGDYKDTPRGRVFYNPSTETYEIKVGSWINDNKDAIEEILDEFDLRDKDFKIMIDPHWEIGTGWENY